MTTINSIALQLVYSKYVIYYTKFSV